MAGFGNAGSAVDAGKGSPAGRPAVADDPGRRPGAARRRGTSSSRGEALLGALLAVPLFGLSTAAGATPPPSPGNGSPVPGAVSGRLRPALVPIGVVPHVPASDRGLGQMASGRSLQVGLALKPRDPAALAAYATGVSQPSSPLYHHYMTPSELAARFGPSSATVAAAERALRADGLSLGTLPADHLLVPATGTVGRIESAFHVRMNGYRLAGGQSGWASSGLPLLPRSLAGSVAALIGLDQLSLPRALGVAAASPATSSTASGGSASTAPGSSNGGSDVMLQRALRGARPTPAKVTKLPTACNAALQTALGTNGWTDDAIANAYGFSPLLTRGDLGAGETIALFELEPFASSDIAGFDRCYYGHARPKQVKAVRVDGFGLAGPGVGESVLDIEDLQALAPDARILVYEAPNTTWGGLDEYNAIVSQDRANIVSTSWGECETASQIASPGAQQVENTIFEEAAAEGQTVLAASGDTGSDDCASTPFGTTTPAAPYRSVDDPASQPYVLAVGGVSLDTATTPPSETAWNDGSSLGGGGGGFSNSWPSPSWQVDSGIPGTGPGMRRLPDGSASADEFRGTTVFSKDFAGKASGSSGLPSGWSVIGGTSSATPQWAAALAIIADSASCRGLPVTAGGPDLGFAAPELYAVASGAASYRASFTNVTKGNNDVFGLGNGYSAGPGFNMATGLGSPLLTGPGGRPGLAADLCAVALGKPTVGASVPDVSSVSPASGPIAGGTPVTITGSGFPSGSPSEVSVQFGAAAAAVQSVTATSITVTAPASATAPATQSFAGASDVAVSVTVTGGGAARTSLPSPGAHFDYVGLAPGGAGTPTVTGVAPSGGITTGGGTVTIFGNSFTTDGGVTSVTFGGVSTAFRVLSDSELTAAVPSEGASTACASGSGFDPANVCQVEVVVSDAAGSSPTSTILPALTGPIVFTASGVVKPTPETEVAATTTEYDYAPKPVITSISPDPAGASSTSPVVLHGSGFSLVNLEWVNFGPWTSTSSEQFRYTSISPTELGVMPPASPATPGVRPAKLTGGVSVQTDSGKSNNFPFSYAGVPSESGLSRLGGPQTGDTVVKMTGSGLADVTQVQVESEISPAYGVSVGSVVRHERSGSLLARLPAYLPGPAAVVPCTPTACAKVDKATDTYVYYDAGHPALLGATASKGPAAGGTLDVLFGYNIDSATAVRFGANAATIVHHGYYYPDGDPFVLVVRSAPGPAGKSVGITVVTPTGTVSSTKAVFDYLASSPSAPVGLAVRAKPARTVLSWAAPLSDGGSAVSSYTAVAQPPDGSAVAGTAAAGGKSVVFSDLAAGTPYSFRVAASNRAHGRGPFAALSGTVPYLDDGYRLAQSGGAVLGFGSLHSLGGTGGVTASGGSRTTGIASTHDAHGYWIVQANGTVSAFGDALRLRYAHPSSPVAAIASTADGGGYWLLTASGAVLAFGDAHAYGKPSSDRTSDPAVAIAASQSGLGYAVMTASGDVHGYGDLSSLHAAVRLPAHERAVGLALGARGPLVLLADGAVLAPGAPPSAASPPLPAGDGTATGITSAPDGLGYWIVTSRGAVVARGAAHVEGDATAGSRGVTVGIAAA